MIIEGKAHIALHDLGIINFQISAIQVGVAQTDIVLLSAPKLAADFNTPRIDVFEIDGRIILLTSKSQPEAKEFADPLVQGKDNLTPAFFLFSLWIQKIPAGPADDLRNTQPSRLRIDLP